jgi:hypothetical protein
MKQRAWCYSTPSPGVLLLLYILDVDNPVPGSFDLLP